MSAVVELLKTPVVTAGGGLVAAAVVAVREAPFRPVEIEVGIPAAGLTAPPPPGAAVAVAAGALKAEGHARSVERVRITSAEAVTVTAACRAAPWRPRAVCFRTKARSFCLRALLTDTPLAAKAGPVGDEQRAWHAVLAGAPWDAAAQLALLGGQLLLNSAAGAVLVRPDQPGAATPLPASAFFSVTTGAAPGVALRAPDPKAWGAALAKDWAPAGPAADVLALALPTAASAAELGAAGAAVRAAAALGRFVATGGPELLGVGPGDWVSHPAGSKHLVTARTLTWTRGGGWHVELSGDYPWAALAAPHLDSEPAEVTGFDADSGRLTVRLPLRDGVVIGAFPSAARGGADSYRLTVPAVGERGLVAFAGGADHALYLGAAAPAGVLTAADFPKVVGLARTPGSSARELNDGTAEFAWKSLKVVCRSAAEYVASLFKFNKG